MQPPQAVSMPPKQPSQRTWYDPHMRPAAVQFMHAGCAPAIACSVNMAELRGPTWTRRHTSSIMAKTSPSLIPWITAMLVVFSV